MDVTITQESAIKVKADVVVPWEKVEPHYKASIKTIARTAQLPGFRKGKAPVALLKKRYRDQLLGEVAQLVVPDALGVCMKENDYRPVGTPRLSRLEMKDLENLTFVAEIDVLPKIELKEWRGIEAESLKVEVTAKMVDDALEQRLKAGTHNHEITDRPVEQGDQVTISLTVLDDAEGTALSDIPSYEMDLADDDEVHPILAKAVIGMSVGEDKEEVFDAPEDDSFEEWRGRKVKAFIDVLAINRLHRPSLDDAFAKKQGAENLEELRAKIEKELNESLTIKEEERLQNDLLRKMMLDYDFEVPPDAVRAQAEALASQQLSSLMGYLQGQDPKFQRQFFEQMIDLSFPQAKARVRTELVLDEIVKALDIKVDEDEFNEELEKIKDYYQAKSIEDLKEELTEKGSLDHIREAMARQKAVKQIQEAAKITLVAELTTPVDETEEPSSEETLAEETPPAAETEADEEKDPVE